MGGSREHVLHGNVDAAMGKGTVGMSGRLKSIVKHRILGVAVIAPALKILVAFVLSIVINSLMR